MGGCLDSASGRSPLGRSASPAERADALLEGFQVAFTLAAILVAFGSVLLFLVVRRQDDARDGEIVVALVGDDESADEATVKTFRRDPDGRVRLQPENSALEPIYADHVQILGKVVGVLRSLV